MGRCDTEAAAAGALQVFRVRIARSKNIKTLNIYFECLERFEITKKGDKTAEMSAKMKCSRNWLTALVPILVFELVLVPWLLPCVPLS
jgi:hypothetical protein